MVVAAVARTKERIKARKNRQPLLANAQPANLASKNRVTALQPVSSVPPPRVPPLIVLLMSFWMTKWITSVTALTM
jgi:uncharacterized membrane protein